MSIETEIIRLKFEQNSEGICEY